MKVDTVFHLMLSLLLGSLICCVADPACRAALTEVFTSTSTTSECSYEARGNRDDRYMNTLDCTVNNYKEYMTEWSRECNRLIEKQRDEWDRKFCLP